MLQGRYTGIVAAVSSSPARYVSGAANFAFNKTRVFNDPSPRLVRRQAVEYVLLALFLTGVTILGAEAPRIRRASGVARQMRA